MSYTGESGEVSATAVPMAEMRALTMKSGTVARFVATGSSTRGDFGLYRWEMRAHTGGATGHFHRTFSESFYVLDGNPSFRSAFPMWISTVRGERKSCSAISRFVRLRAARRATSSSRGERASP